MPINPPTSGSSSGVSLLDVATMHRFQLWGHRGDIGSADSLPENTVESLRQAILKGCDGVEYDLYRSSDGTFWLMHDATIDRTTSGTGNVVDKTDAQMAALTIDAGYGYISGSYSVPTLADVIDALQPYDCVHKVQLNASSDANATALAEFIVANARPSQFLIEVTTLTEAAAVKAVSASLAVIVNVGVSGADSDANVDWLSVDESLLVDLDYATALAPKRLGVFQPIADYGTDEYDIILAAWERGATSYQTNDVDAALAVQQSLVSGGLPARKDWLTDTKDEADYPASPNALDDEFEGDGSIDAKWTKVNDPAGGAALSQSAQSGYLYVSLAENTGTDNFDALVRLHQTAPAGTALASYVAKVALTANGHIGGEGSEFATVMVYIGNPTNDEMVAAGIQVNWTTGQYEQFLSQAAVGQKASAGSITAMTNAEAVRGIVPGQHVYIRLSKLDTTAYTSACLYGAYISGDGLIWQIVGYDTITFTTLPTEVGIAFRRPKSQAGTPAAESLVDFFRRTV